MLSYTTNWPSKLGIVGGEERWLAVSAKKYIHLNNSAQRSQAVQALVQAVQRRSVPASLSGRAGGREGVGIH